MIKIKKEISPVSINGIEISKGGALELEFENAEELKVFLEHEASILDRVLAFVKDDLPRVLEDVSDNLAYHNNGLDFVSSILDKKASSINLEPSFEEDTEEELIVPPPAPTIRSFELKAPREECCDEYCGEEECKDNIDDQLSLLKDYYNGED